MAQKKKATAKKAPAKKKPAPGVPVLKLVQAGQSKQAETLLMAAGKSQTEAQRQIWKAQQKS